MGDQEAPKKPRRNPGHIVFSEKGSVRRVVEEMPRQKESLELAIGQKFIGALRHFHGLELHDLKKGAEPADLTCRSATGERVSVQVVEAIDQNLRKVQTMRSSYREALASSLGEDLLLFNGCRVTLVDSGDPPYLPLPATREGEACLETLVEHVRTVARQVRSLRVGYRRARDVRVGASERKVAALIERVAAPSDPPRLEFTWSGAGPSYTVGQSRGILAAAVRTKVAKNYVKPRGDRFLLLVYSMFSLFDEEDPDITEARHVLENASHPFDESWYLLPYAEKSLGHLVRVWSSDRDG